MRVDALVVGAGPAGATAARLLAQAGWSVVLAEKTEFPRRKVCGEFISATTFPILDACGIGSDFRRLAGPPVRRVALYAGETMLASPSGEKIWGLALGRDQLDLLLRDAAVQAGAQLHQPAELVAIHRDGDGHFCTLRDKNGEQEFIARVIVAASGSWNAKGPLALSADDSAPSDLFAFKALFRGGALPDNLMPLIAFPGGYGGMVHTDGGRTSLSCCLRRDALAKARVLHGGKAADAALAHICASTLGVRRALKGTVPDGAFLSTGPIRPGIRPRYASGVFATGNIAGEAHPIIAEGISMAIQSSWLLSQRLIAAGPKMSAAQQMQIGADYARAWRSQFSMRIHVAALFANLAMRDETRALCKEVITRFPRLLTWGARISGKAKMIYRLDYPARSYNV